MKLPMNCPAALIAAALLVSPLCGCTTNPPPAPTPARAASAPASPGQRLTKAQVIEIAKPSLPLPAGEAYYVDFKDGVWNVWTSPDGSIRMGYGATVILLIQDSDGKVLGTTAYL